MKTIEEKLKSATKKLKQQSQNIKALRHLVHTKAADVNKLKADIQVKDAQIQSASMFINYMAACFQEDEVKIKLTDLYQYAAGYDALWKKDDEAGVIIIKTCKKSDKQE